MTPAEHWRRADELTTTLSDPASRTATGRLSDDAVLAIASTAQVHATLAQAAAIVLAASAGHDSTLDELADAIAGKAPRR